MVGTSGISTSCEKAGSPIVADEIEADASESIGDIGVRRITTQPPHEYRGRVVLDESRPWHPRQTRLRLELELDLTGPEELGLSRAERRKMLEAA